MYVLLPDQPTGLPVLERQLTVRRINRIIDSLQEKKLDSLKIPKFSLKDKKVFIFVITGIYVRVLKSVCHNFIQIKADNNVIFGLGTALYGVY